ncbi:protein STRICTOSIDINE SYNTHASE-LIKE 11-like [Neltuma alba]|uniref:protein STRICTOSIDINE SYNTHASE-LIKE 11-like n=1 Tax=Neltuma alba TaxID=207710 RepID=UPI0010A3B553|nr:protein STRICTOSIDINE SYNTHASE-LIKE 11-like [Prosopis alba]XP_028772643.1 protein STRICTOSIDINE SYNTHASE-LIKE 11-like [Prosopis alba]
MSNIAILVVFALLICSSSVANSNRLLSRQFLPPPLTGPESLAFDSVGEGPYTGASDGRILKYVGPSDGFVEFASSSPCRNKTICDGISDFSEIQKTCGRPLGLAFNYQTSELYIADAYFGLMKVPSSGGSPTQVVSCVEGKSFRFLAGLDIDPQTGVVYFTEASTTYQIRDLPTLLRSGDNSGSLVKFDPCTMETSVLLRDLAVPSGVAVSKDGSYVLVSEFMANRVQRFWLEGDKQNTSEIFLQLPGKPDNIKRNSAGDFWVAVNNQVGSPPPSRPPVLPLAVRVDGNGFVLQEVALVEEYGTEMVSEVQEFNGKLYSASLDVSYVNVFMP